MLNAKTNIGTITLWVSAFLFFLLPLSALVGYMFFTYERASATYVLTSLRWSDVDYFMSQPEMKLLSKLVSQSAFLSLIVFAYSFLLAFLFLWARKVREIALISLLLSLCFIVPAILKSYAWNQISLVLPFWDFFALPAFLAVSLSVFYFSAITIRVSSLGLNTLLSLDEYFGQFRLVFELLRFCIGPAIFAALCIFAVVLFSGIEVQHLSRTAVTFTQVVGGFWGGREREAGFLALVSMVFIVAAAVVSVNVVWKRAG